MISLGILGSGRGSNARSIFEAIEAGRLDARVVCVLSDVSGSGILEQGRARAIPSFHVAGDPFRTKLDGSAQDRVIDLLRAHSADTVVLAGFMRMVKPGLLQAFPGRVLNIHPALLPAFPGLEAWKQALDAGVDATGCTVHFVDEGMDTGPIILQRRVPVLPGDTAESLHARIQEQEHIAYPEALALLAAGRLRLEGGKVIRS